MSTKKYRIRLTTDEQQELNALVSRGRAAAYKQTHARILLMSDESRSGGQRARCGTVNGRASALNRKKQLRQKRLTVDSDGLRGTAGGACQLALKLLADQLGLEMI